MADEVKNVAAEGATEQKAPEKAYEYKVWRLSNGLWDFEPESLDGENQSIDKYHVALDIIELGRKLEKQMILEEAEARVMRKLENIAAAQTADMMGGAGAEVDPTQA